MELFKIKWKSLPKKSLKILGSKDIFKIKINNYRVVYSINNGELIIEIIRVRHRKDVYININ